MQLILEKYAVSMWQTLFGHPVRAFGVVSLLLLISLAIAPAKNHFSEWRHYQKQYLSLIRGRGDAVTLQRHFHDGIQQIWLPQLGVVDRCTTCHVGLKEASLADVSTQPFRRHPVIPHTLDQFGCVMCHRGQGAATTVEEAHRSTLAWEQPILPARYVQSSCGQCHRAPLAGTPQLNSGRNLLGRYGCVHCHTIKLPDGSAIKPTDDPPSLEHIADKTTREWIYAWLKDPQAYAVTATMPNFKLSDPDARDISAFLIANSTPIPGDTAAGSQEIRRPPDPTAGASLYGESFCASCHAVQNAAGNVVGGDVGPELTRDRQQGEAGMAARLVAQSACLRCGNGHAALPLHRSAGFAADWLSSETRRIPICWPMCISTLATPEQIAHGKLLVTEYGCASCHEISGVKKPDNFAPELTRIGSKPITQISFLPGMPHTVPDYISAKIRQPRSFGSALKMPQYTFAPAQVDALTTALALAHRPGA